MTGLVGTVVVFGNRSDPFIHCCGLDLICSILRDEHLRTEKNKTDIKLTAAGKNARDFCLKCVRCTSGLALSQWTVPLLLRTGLLSQSLRTERDAFSQWAQGNPSLLLSTRLNLNLLFLSTFISDQVRPFLLKPRVHTFMQYLWALPSPSSRRHTSLNSFQQRKIK